VKGTRQVSVLAAWPERFAFRYNKAGRRKNTAANKFPAMDKKCCSSEAATLRRRIACLIGSAEAGMP